MAPQRVRQALDWANKAKSFVLEDMWRYDPSGQRKVYGWAVRLLKMSFLVYKNLHEKRFFLRAHALTYWTLISIVPVLAVMVIVLKGFGQSDMAEKNFWPRVESLIAPAAGLAVGPQPTEGNAPPNPAAQTAQQARVLVGKIRDFVDRINSRAIGAAGMTVAILTVISLLTKIEQGFNDIWDIRRKRTFVNRVVVYWGVVTLPAVLIVVSSGMKIASKGERFLERIKGRSSVLRDDDILDWQALCSKLEQEAKAKRGPSARILELAGPKTQSAIAAIAAGKDRTDERTHAVIDALNAMLDRADFHQPQAFASVAVPPEAAKLLERQAKAGPLAVDDVRRLNRLLLEAAFPKQIAKSSKGIPIIGGLARRIIPFVFTWIAFSLLYKIMPNARVRTRSAVVAGVVAGTLWQAANQGYGLYLSWTSGKLAVYTVVYGSMAAVPIFLMWVYLSWAIVLFGAGVAYADQNLAVFEREGVSLDASFAARQFVALRACVAVGQAFHYDRKPLPALTIASRLRVPISIVNDCLQDLSATGYLAEAVADDEAEEVTYQPASSLENYKLIDLMEDLRERCGRAFHVPDDKAKALLDDAIQRVRTATQRELGDVTLHDIVVEAGGLGLSDGEDDAPAIDEPTHGAGESMG